MKRIETRLSAPLAGMAMLTVGLLVVVLFMSAARVDRDALEHEQALVARGMQAKVVDIERTIWSEVGWDEAVEHLDHRYDPSWARENIGAYLVGQAGFDQIVVLDHAGRPVFNERLGQPVSSAWYDRHAPTFFGPILDRLRQREATTPRPTGPRPDGDMVSRPIQVSAVERLDGDAYLVTASLVQSDFGKALIRHARAPVVLTALKLDAAFLDGFASRFLLPGVHLHSGDATAQADDAHLGLRNLNGQIVATLDWQPPHPGQRLLRKAILPILLVVGGLGVAVIVFARRSRKIAEGLIASEARAKHMAVHDALTGLPNRVLFEERLRQAVDGLSRRRQAMAVLAIDLDRFKAVNDTHGHAAGDELIQAMAKRLQTLCRAGETVARLGGDEFAVVAVDLEPKGAAALAERLVQAMSAPVELSCGAVFVGGSVGVALIDRAEGHVGAVEAARRADVAMYRAKEEGRGRYCFFEAEMDAALKARRGLEADLRAALGDGGVWLAYQPQVDANGRVVGVEALARWTHPVKGPISPSAFVPLAEDCGLIDELGRMVMRRAFTDSRRWKGLKVAVNVSALQMKQADFPDQVAALLVETGARAKGIELEITEGALLGDDETTHRAIARLRAMGFSLALDDFGTGYSSLSYLRRYPIDKIKIDRSFITPLGEDEEAGAVVAAIVRLAKALSLSVIAEGVETNQQHRQLREIGCGQAQGFLFSPPTPADRIDALVAGGGRIRVPVEA
ncbi:putative bifunctional diguanylate cyclase/phosphodiesterase [Caulobacter segnis]|uniref:putative bifunctional diguanylate cyclase/phosphodiesterase n=1 Tax=Caulobacter segnis TaxID=88688 RepID=UPI001CBCDADA|nr:EAL domain-containing protein [Caulobacter segnis]UAL11536.1 EAL domain-containing protein [Caulobacter segnis]